MKHIKRIKIDIDKKNFKVIPSVQFDNARFLHINLVNGSMLFDLTGCSVKISGTKPDGTIIFNNCTIINEKEGFIEVELTEQINAVPGIVKCELKLYDGNGVLTTKNFDIEVSASATANGITSSNEFKALTDALKVVQGIDNKADKEKVEEKFGEVYEQLDTIETAKATKIELEVERKRIDNFVSLPEGSTVGNAELTDGRIGADGMTYKNIGDAIREQNKRLSNGLYINTGALSANKMKFMIPAKKNLLDNKMLKLNKYVNAQGDIGNSNGFILIDSYIELNNSKTYKFKYSGQAYYAYYNDKKTFISHVSDNSTTTDKEKTLDIPSGAKYIKISLKEEYLQDAILQEGDINTTSHLSEDIKVNGQNIDDDSITIEKIDTDNFNIKVNGANIDDSSIPLKKIDTSEFETKIQYIKKAKIVIGKYYQHGKITQNASSGASCYEPIKINRGLTYYYSNLYGYFCSVKYEDGTIKALTDYTSNPGNTTASLSGNFTAEQDGYIYLSFNTLISNKEYMFCNCEIPSKYQEGVFYLKLDNLELKPLEEMNNNEQNKEEDNNNDNDDVLPEANNSTKKVTTVTVKQEGTGDYTSLRNCFESIKPNENNEYIVEIYKGTYDIKSYYTAEEWNKESFVGLFVPDYVTLKGIGNKKEIIVKAKDTVYRQNLSTLNLKNTCSLENITVIAEKLRYAIHDDYANNNNIYYKRYVKNCDFIGRDLRFWSVYGSGCKNGCDWEFVDCNFEFDGEVTGKYGFSNHNNVGWDREGFIKFDNCRFGGEGLRFGSLNTGANNINTQVKITGCKMKELLLTEENSAAKGPGILFTVTGYGNRIEKTTIRNSDGKDYSKNIDLI